MARPIGDIPILIVDDSATIRLSIKRVLERAGYRTLAATSGKEGLAILSAQPVSLIVTDQQMPEMQGTEFCKVIREQACFAALPVVCLTSLDDEESIIKIYEAGVSDYLRKPFIGRELLARIEVQLERHSLLKDLENRVEHRTTELANLNQKLTEEVLERKQAAAQLQIALEKAEHAAGVKSRFLANMSHELRTPLNGIIGFTDLVLEEIPQGDGHERLQMVKSSAEAMLRLINDLLDFSKSEAGKLVLEQCAIDLRQLLHNINRFFEIPVNTQGKLLMFEFPESLPENLLGDELRIQQVFMNLIGNALKFTSSGGAIVVIIQVESITDDYVTLQCSINDSGIGISKDSQGALFQPFVQADSSSTRRFGGTGLGLAITAQLVQLMGGEISVVSTPGVGTSFRFTLRLARGQAPVEMPQTSGHSTEVPPRDPKSVSVLIAEDNPVNQKLILALLRKYGYPAILANNGQEALEKLRESEVEIVLMDCQMPVLDGYQATQLIRRHSDERIRTIPIVAVTANALSGDREKCLEAGMNDMVAKPVVPKLLFEVIQKHLRPAK